MWTSGLTMRKSGAMRVLGLAILLVIGFGLIQNLVSPPDDSAAALHPLPAIGFALFGLVFLTGPQILNRNAPIRMMAAIVAVLAIEHLLEASVPGWMQIVGHPRIESAIEGVGLRGVLSVETSFALAVLNLGLLAEPHQRQASLLFLAAAWVATTMGVLKLAFNLTLWRGEMSPYALATMVLVCSAQTLKLRDQPFLRPLFAQTSYGTYTRALVTGALVVPWMSGFLYFLNVRPDPATHLALELAFGFIGWIMLALVLSIGHLMEKSSLALEHAARHDPLTGALNRRGLSAALGSRDEARGVVLFDLDHFKAVNDALGHDAGDQLLRDIAEIVTRNVRDSDLLVRWGGEEFLVVMTSSAEVLLVQTAERLRQAIAAHTPMRIGATTRPVTASFGVSMAHPGETGIAAAIRRADEALYAAKIRGRNRVFSAAALCEADPGTLPAVAPIEPARLVS
ncbi:sensor domain-containing diguanylate cyclase [Rhodovulum visakhapatnamense]|uniref:diguanylate cyclase n=2 Tax=Rhodovulum visakhapatnamense TaxID=364297 RepID=A0ABS1RL91_9RHOB|nr:GGDEF domain-containing protein [Rhodovulum visakhapatnamense]MBL3568443.1 GGDEF domain-containing protein [Rhodovulum visakhapatnamense]MBL3580413.1 GGDEF domain-containing protein [Rhodovulum visakhapatnamense]